MADFTDNKTVTGALYPQGAIETPQDRLESIITAEEVRLFHLFGVPLVSAIRNPITGRQDIITDTILAKYIDRAVAQVELDTGLTILPIVVKERQPLDRQELNSFGYMRLKQRPVAAILKLAIAPTNDIETFVVPNEWLNVDVSGQVNFIPLTFGITAGGGQVPTTSVTGSSLFMSFFASHSWVPFFWMIDYQIGFPNGRVPKIVNELVGVVVAMEILSQLAATFSKQTSGSLSLDGVSESISGPGPQLFTTRISELSEKRKRLVGKIKAQWGLDFITGNV